MGDTSPLSSYEQRVNNAESYLSAAQDSLAQAKKNGNYKNAGKIYTTDGVKRNIYDDKVYCAKKELAAAKKALAEAKKRYK